MKGSRAGLEILVVSWYTHACGAVLHVPSIHVHVYSVAVFQHLVRKWVNYVLVTGEVCFVLKCGHTVDAATSRVYLPFSKRHV